MSELSKKEKLILYGLSLYPHYSDVKLSRFLGITQSTFSTAKRRLRAKNYFKMLYLPAFQKLGCEVLFIGYGPFNVERDDIKTSKIIHPKMDLFSKIFFFGRGLLEGGLMGICRNITEMKDYINALETYMVKKKLIPENSWKFLSYSFETSRIISFFDYHRIINDVFSLRMDVRNEPDDMFWIGEQVTLSTIEKEIFYNFIRYPEYNDTQLANLLNLSRLTVSKVRKKFENAGLMKKICVVDMRKLGCDILVYSHNVMRTGLSVEDRMYSINFLLANSPIMFGIVFSKDSFTLFCEKEYCLYELRKWKILNHYHKRGFFANTPDVHATCCTHVKYPLYITFTPLVSEILKQGDDWKKESDDYFF